MKAWILSIVLLSSFISGCSTTGKNQEVLKERSVHASEMRNLSLGLNHKKVRRTNSGVAHAWRHETDLPSGDYFWGGWISAVVTKPQWAKPPRH